jgi:hypothetical protein
MHFQSLEQGVSEGKMPFLFQDIVAVRRSLAKSEIRTILAVLLNIHVMAPTSQLH